MVPAAICFWASSFWIADAKPPHGYEDFGLLWQESGLFDLQFMASSHMASLRIDPWNFCARIVLVSVALILTLFSGPAAFAQTPAPAPAAKDGLSAPAAPADPWGLPDPVAKINGEAISASEFKAFASVALQERPIDSLQDSEKTQLFNQAMDAIIAEKLISQAAKGEQIDNAKVEEELKRFEEQFGSREKLEEELKKDGKSFEELRKMIESSQRQRAWFEPKIAALTEVTEDEMKKFYASTPEASRAPEVVRASHILLLTPPEGGEEIAKQKLKEIQEIRAKIVAGEPFEIMAKNHSEDPGSKDKGGDLNYFRRGEMVKEFEDVAFSLPAGEVSGPVKTQYGYHLIKVTDHKAAANVSFEEVKPRIQAFLEDRKRREAVRKVIDGLRAEATIENFLR
jgi:peptidyl-prolyl cis-trans isomerase C